MEPVGTSAKGSRTKISPSGAHVGAGSVRLVRGRRQRRRWTSRGTVSTGRSLSRSSSCVVAAARRRRDKRRVRRERDVRRERQLQAGRLWPTWGGRSGRSGVASASSRRRLASPVAAHPSAGSGRGRRALGGVGFEPLMPCRRRRRPAAGRVRRRGRWSPSRPSKNESRKPRKPRKPRLRGRAGE